MRAERQDCILGLLFFLAFMQKKRTFVGEGVTHALLFSK